MLAAESKQQRADQAAAGAAAEEATAAKLKEDARQEHLDNRNNSTAVKGTVSDMNSAEAAAEAERQALIVESQVWCGVVWYGVVCGTRQCSLLIAHCPLFTAISSSFVLDSCWFAAVYGVWHTSPFTCSF